MRTPNGHVSTIRLGNSSGSQDYSHSHWPGLCLHWAPGKDLTRALLRAPRPQAAATSHSCREGTRKMQEPPTPPLHPRSLFCREGTDRARSWNLQFSLFPRPHHFQPQQASQGGSRCPHGTGHRECARSARRERALGGGAPSQSQVPYLELGQELLPCPGAHAAYKHQRTPPPGPEVGRETPASREGWTPSTAGRPPAPASAPHQAAPQHRCPAAGWGSRPGW